MHSMHDMPGILRMQAAAVKLQQCNITPSLRIDHNNNTRHEMKPNEQQNIGNCLKQNNCSELKLSKMQGVLSPPQPLGSSLLLPRPWALLLRILLQQGVPEHLLQQLTQPSLGDESTLESAVWSLFPEDCQKAWQTAPHRMGTAEAQVSSHNACVQPS